MQNYLCLYYSWSTIYLTLCLSIALLVLLSSCKTDNTYSMTSAHIELADTHIDTTLADTIQKSHVAYIIDYDTILWTEILPSPNLILDLKYATLDNFTDQQIYDCGRCFLRPHIAEAFMRFATHIQEEYNLGLVLYDCYRPRPYQQKLWDIMPDWRYVTPPEKGSMHNRGMAIDIGLLDSLGHLMDMGTPFDHFGKDSFHSAQNISSIAIKNRKLLKSELEKFGFKSITSEWWHYSYREDIMGLSDWVWHCQ